MVTVFEWEKYFRTLDSDRLIVLKLALMVLKEHKLFEQEFGELGLFQLIYSIDYLLLHRSITA